MRTLLAAVATIIVVAAAGWLALEPARTVIASDLAGPPSPVDVADPLLADPVLADPGAEAFDPEPRLANPAKLRVPAIGVDTEVVRLGRDRDGAMEVPDDFSQAGWYHHGATPGQVGAAVIAGHVDSTTGPAVFSRLTALTPGDEIVVETEAAHEVRFVVTAVERHPKDAFPTLAVFGATDERALRLVTCGGEFDPTARSYRDNVVVYAVAE